MLKEYLLNNLGELQKVIHEINSYNDALYYLEVYENDSWFFEEFFKDSPQEAVRASLYGDYNYNDPYVKFDGYMNLTSLNETDYQNLLFSYIDEVIEEIYKLKDDCKWIDKKIIELANEEL